MAGPSRELPAAALAALTKGQKIDAIKIVRQQWGIGLKESKDAVDAYVAARPELATQIQQANGPAGSKAALLLIILLVAASILLYFAFHR